MKRIHILISNYIYYIFYATGAQTTAQCVVTQMRRKWFAYECSICCSNTIPRKVGLLLRTKEAKDKRCGVWCEVSATQKQLLTAKIRFANRKKLGCVV